MVPSLPDLTDHIVWTLDTTIFDGNYRNGPSAYLVSIHVLHMYTELSVQCFLKIFPNNIHSQSLFAAESIANAHLNARYIRKLWTPGVEKHFTVEGALDALLFA